MKEAWPLLAKGGDFEILKAWKQVLTTSEREFHKQRVIKIVGDFVHVSKDGSVVGNCFKPLSKPKEKEKFDISDEELDKFLSEVDWSKIDKEVQQRTIAEQFGVSNSTFTNCSFNISFAGNK